MASKYLQRVLNYFDAMKSTDEVAAVLRQALAASPWTQAALRTQAGLSQRTLTNVLGGRQDFKLSTLLALADRLGLELLLVPKGAAAAVDAGQTDAPQVRSRVAAALQAVQAPARE